MKRKLEDVIAYIAHEWRHSADLGVLDSDTMELLGEIEAALKGEHVYSHAKA